MSNPTPPRKNILKEIIPELPALLLRYAVMGGVIAVYTWGLIKFVACY